MTDSNTNGHIVGLYPLIKLLSDGRFYSGEHLGEQLQISRAAVWKKIRKLESLGLPCHSVRGKGYRLENSIQLLDAARLAQIVDDELGEHNLEIDLRAQVDSTNDLALDAARGGQSSGYTCLAEQQLSGRGRLGRNWVSPFARNIYLSMLWRFPAGARSLEGLSLAIGVAVVRALEKSSLSGLALKWPNDVLLNGEKLAGILLEMHGDSSGQCSVVIGVGVNVDMPQSAGVAIAQPWTDLGRHLSNVDRNKIAGSLLAEIYRSVQMFSESGFLPHKSAWEKYDGFFGERVSILLGEKELIGRAAGISDRGEFCLDIDGELRHFGGGEISVRKCL
ncbi:MAG: bifunctional biotin--[acetyl-CoA-carboxylase] ligase/biotin operon repressor BirA [Pseudomonadales bacterium]|nr:bifunctional biotin--[acetyl-CoA-carboxylase] ligase/biotin operon repressor BirA [Pseudomonadales bacterium]